jgi:hypothetical protein
MPLIEVKLLSLPNKTSARCTTQLGSERDVSFKQQDSKERLVMGPIR